MSDVEDTIDLTASSSASHPLPAPPTTHTPFRRSPSSDKKRKREDSPAQPNTVLAQISTWEVPPDILSVEPTPDLKPEPDDPATSMSRAAVPEPLSAYTCPICFSPPTNATMTPCGHICCGQCLFTAVKATMRRNMVMAMDGPPVARCPVCRAEIAGWDGRGGGVIGLKMQVLYSL